MHLGVKTEGLVEWDVVDFPKLIEIHNLNEWHVMSYPNAFAKDYPTTITCSS